MEYRKLGRTGLLVSEIGMGCEGFVGKPYSEVEKMVDAMQTSGNDLLSTERLLAEHACLAEPVKNGVPSGCRS